MASGDPSREADTLALAHRHGDGANGVVVSPPTLAEAARVWARIGVLSFGGPAGQIALIHRELVEERRWLDERTFLSALNFCMLLPGPEAMQLQTYAGWRLNGVAGGLVAGLLFVLPGAVLVGILSAIYVTYGALPVLQAVFLGVKAAVLAIVFEALMKVSRRALSGAAAHGLAIAAFLALFVFALPFPLIVVAAGLIGAVVLRGPSSAMAEAPAAAEAPVRIVEVARTAAIWLAVWIVPLALVVALTGADSVFADLALFFSKLAVVTFGGAYAVLSYMAQQAVETHGWLEPGEMLDGLGLAETTPGPLILVTQFVGFLAAYREGGSPQMLAGLLGIAVTLWATFAPCFLWIFTGAPFISRLESAPRLKAALAGVTAAVVGVIANLSVWFAFHVLFARSQDIALGPVAIKLPLLHSFDALAFGLSALGFVSLFVFRLGVLGTLAVCAGVGLAVHLVA